MADHSILSDYDGNVSVADTTSTNKASSSSKFVVTREALQRILECIVLYKGHKRFCDFCNTDFEKFGAPNSKGRRIVQGRYNRLLSKYKNHPAQFRQICFEYNVDPPLVDCETFESSPFSSSINTFESNSFESPASFRSLNSKVFSPPISKVHCLGSPPNRIKVNNENKQHHHSSGKPPASTMNHPKSTFTLDLEWPCNNPDSIMATKIVNEKVGKKLMNFIKVEYHMHDLMDMDPSKVDKIINAKLATGGGNMNLLVPAVPYYVRARMAEMEALDKAAKEYCEKAVDEGRAVVHAMARNKVYGYKTIVLNFPDDIVCCMDHFNKNSDGTTLTPHLRVLQTEFGTDASGKMIKTFYPYIFWYIAIEGETREVEGEEDKVENLLANALNGIKLK